MSVSKNMEKYVALKEVYDNSGTHYYVGDIINYEASDLYLNRYMELISPYNKDYFMLLKEYREKQLNNLGI